jgi:hypothetical protein
MLGVFYKSVIRLNVVAPNYLSVYNLQRVD